MSIEPKAKNNLNTSLLHEYRSYYKFVTYPKEYENNIDLWYNSFLYGKVDTNVNPIILQNDNFKSINNFGIQQKPLYAANFVVDSYNEFIEEVRRADQYLKIPKSILNPIKVKKASLIFDEEYSIKTKNLLNSLMNISVSILEKNIISFDDYLKLFLSNILITKTRITQTGYLTSKVCSPNISGLALELSTLEHDDDNKKFKQYLQDPNYQFFINTAEKYSFYVDKNAPWRMVFNLNTEYAKNKFKQYDCNNLEEVFNKIYKPSYLTDYKVLKNVLIDGYVEKVLKKPSIQKYYYCELNNSLLFEIVNKQQKEQINKTDLFWIQVYYYIRLIEENKLTNQQEFDKKLQYIKNLYEISGETKCLDWINNQTKTIVDGGANPGYNEFVDFKKSQKKKITSAVVFKF
jgi:hypothetical protein